MAVDVLTPPTDEEIRQSAESRLLFEERQRLEAQYRSDYERGQQQHAAVRQQRAAIEQDAAQAIAELKPLYQARAAAAQKLSVALAEFATAEAQIKTALAPIDQRLAGAWVGLDASQQSERMQSMRRAGGLLPVHADLGAPGLDRLGRTVAGGLVAGHIGEGFVSVGGRSLVID